MQPRHLTALACALTVLLLAGCPKGNSEFSQGKKAESINDYDTALAHYNKALQSDPQNTEYKLKMDQMRFEASQWHVEQGRKLREQSQLQLALTEFQKAMLIDPSSPIAQQEARATVDLIKGAEPPAAKPGPADSGSESSELMTGPPVLKPLSRTPIFLKSTNDAKAVFDAVGQLAGITVIFDPDFVSRRISIELPNVTLEQALNLVAMESKSFWRPVTNNIIFVAQDQQQKRKDYEEEVLKTFYLKNNTQPQDITEISTAIRQFFNLQHVQQINQDNAILVRATPDVMMLVQRIIDSLDKAKPEVVVQVAVLQTNLTRMLDLGISPGTSASLTFTPPTTSGTTGATASSSSLPINQLRDTHIFQNDYSIQIPSATASFLMNDSSTKIIDNPEIRIVDGQTAKLRIGDKVPVATGSFQAGIGVGGTGAGGLVNPLVNTQFQYLEVGVNVDVTPRIHPEGDVSLKLNIVVSSVTGSTNIGGINQPIISQRSIEHDVRLKDGEVNILGGLIERTEQKSVSGWPGLAKLPFFRYFFADNNVQSKENEVLIVLIPHIVRKQEITADDLRAIASGTDTNPTVRLEDEVMTPPVPKGQSVVPAPSPATPGVGQPSPATPAQPGTQPAQQQPAQPATLRFDPGTISIKPGETTTINIVVQNVQDLYSIPLLLQYNPAVISVEDVQHGAFLSGGTQDIPLVQTVNKERGQAIISATRMPNTPGVSGAGTLLGIVVRGVSAGTSPISIVQINARDSQQHAIQFVTGEASVTVQRQ